MQLDHRLAQRGRPGGGAGMGVALLALGALGSLLTALALRRTAGAELARA
ncbi:hypothetical protein [Deinococcus sp. LM3]|nr:hypothetical protein [Deinococcus sp. LM3]